MFYVLRATGISCAIRHYPKMNATFLQTIGLFEQDSSIFLVYLIMLKSILFKPMLKSFLILLCLSLSVHRYATAKPDSIKTVPQLLDSVKKIMNRNNIPGLLLTLVTRDSVIFSGGVGLADLKNNIPVHEHHLFRMGSVSKSFAALAILQLIEQGKLSLDDRLRDIAPEVTFENEWETTDPLKVVHLLEHTTGFDDMHFSAMHNSETHELPLPQMIRRHENSLHCRWKPGSRFSYSNPGYVILTYLIEKFSGQNYRDYIAQHILRPVGMTESNFVSFIPSGDESDYAKGYSWEDGGYDDVPFNPINGAAAGTLNSSAHDMGRFVQCLLNSGRIGDTLIVAPASIDRMEISMSSLASRSGMHHGYGLANFRRKQGTWAWMQGHSGGIDGFASYYGYNRYYGAGFALSNNAMESNKAIITLVTDFLTRNLDKPTRTTSALDLASIEPYLGFYSFSSPRNEILAFAERLINGFELALENDTLTVKTLFEKPLKLIPASANIFYRGDNLEADVIMTKDENGQLVYIYDAYYYEKSSAFIYWLRLGGIVASVVLLITYVLYTLIWLVRIQSLSREEIFIRLWPLTSIIFFAAMIFCFNAMLDPLIDAGQFNWKTAGYALFSALWLVISLASFLVIFRGFSFVRRKFTAMYITGVIAANGILSVYFFINGMIGKCFWLY